VRGDPLAQHDVRTRVAQRGRPPGRVAEEERLQRAGDLLPQPQRLMRQPVHADNHRGQTFLIAA
jgi:hypothetical protein